MQENNNHLLDNLLEDTSFKNWVYKTNRNDISYWNTWIHNNPEQIDTIYTARDIILGISFNKNLLSDTIVNQNLESVLKNISPQLNTKNKLKQKNINTRGIKIASAAFISILFIVLGFNFYTTPDQVSHKTEYGEIINLTLPDGTIVVLNGNSTLEYKKSDSRNVYLVGEAYFKVKPILSTHAKFWVNTNDLKVEVYGTHFHVNTRDKKTDVVLDEGSISLLLENGTSQKMIPGEYVSFSKENEVITHKKVSTNNKYSFWREGTYIFNNTTLEEVMRNIEYSYGLSSDFTNEELKNKLITGGIPNGNLKICLSAIEKSTGTKIIKKDNKLLIIKD